MRTFNCGVGFCLITSKKNVSKITRIFPKNYLPYKIGFISNNKNKVSLIKNLKW